MEPGTQNNAETQAVYIRTRPQYALCNVYYYSIRFVNVAGGASEKGATRDSGRNRDAFWGMRSFFEDSPTD